MSAPVLQNHRFEDAALQGDSLEWLDVDYYQMNPGRYDGRLSQLSLEEVSVRHEWQNRDVHKRGVTVGDFCAISLFTEDRVDGWCNGQRYELPLSPLFFLPANSELDLFMKGGTSLSYIILEQQSLWERAQILEPSLLPWRGGELMTLGGDSRLVLRLMRLIEERHRLGMKTDWAVMQDHLLNLFSIELADSSGAQAAVRSSFGRKHKVVRRTRDYIMDRLAQQECPSIVDICREVGVSQRTLQYCFLDLLQMTPVAFLRVLRLNKVHSELIRPETIDRSVTDVATRYGFWHLGGFARDFRLHFGEPPSEILKRGRRQTRG